MLARQQPLQTEAQRVQMDGIQRRALHMLVDLRTQRDLAVQVTEIELFLSLHIYQAEM